MPRPSVLRRRAKRPVNPAAKRYRALSLLLVWVNIARRSSGILFAFVTGIWVNDVSDAEVRGFGQLVSRVYDPGTRPTAWLAIVPTAVLLLLPAVRLVLRVTLRRASYAVALAGAIGRVSDPVIGDYARGRIRWGSQIVLQNCPRIEEGWTPDDVEIKKDPQAYRNPLVDTLAFKNWFDDDANKYLRSGVGLRLMENPTSFTDDSRLRLRVQEIPFAAAAYFNRTIAVDLTKRRAELSTVFDGTIAFPHVLSMHAVVATADGWILLTKRSSKVFYHPGTWSCSIEEQLAVRDFEGTGERVARRWVDRMLNEELGLRGVEAATADVRFLAVFLEADIMNVAVASLVTLAQDRDTIDAIIDARARQDYEFSEWAFIRWSAICEELLRPGVEYHPSSALRMYLAGLAKFGVYEFGVQLSRTAAGKPRRRIKPWTAHDR